jgi:hypothetical protein
MFSLLRFCSAQIDGSLSISPDLVNFTIGTNLNGAFGKFWGRYTIDLVRHLLILSQYVSPLLSNCEIEKEIPAEILLLLATIDQTTTV